MDREGPPLTGEMVEELARAKGARLAMSGNFCPEGCHFNLEMVSIDGDKLSYLEIIHGLHKFMAMMHDEIAKGASSTPWLPPSMDKPKEEKKDAPKKEYFGGNFEADNPGNKV